MLFLLYLWAIRNEPSVPHGFWLALVMFVSVTLTIGAIELALVWPTLTAEQRRKKVKRLLLVGLPYGWMHKDE